MGTIANLLVHIGANTDSLEKGMSHSVNVVGSAMKAIAVGIAATGGAFLALGKIGVDYNRQMEEYTTNFKVMLGSQEAAISKVEELKTMAAATPFAMNDLASATQTLLAFQVPAEETTKIMSMLGDVALGDKNKLSGLATVFGQVSSAGKLQGQDLMQLINQGFNPLNYISQRTGESMEELRDRMSKGAVTADEVTQAFIDATSAGGQFYNGMEEASKTMSGLMSTLEDNARSLIGEVFMPISESIAKDLIPQALGYIDDLTKAFKENGVEGLVGAAGTILSSVITKLAEGAPKFVDTAVLLIQSLVDGIIDNLPTIIDAGITMFMSLIEALPDIIVKICDALPLIVEGIATALTEDNIGTIIDAGVDLLVALINNTGEIIKIIAEHLPTIVDGIAKGFIDNIDKIIAGGITLFVALVDSTANIVSAIADKIPEIIDGISAALTSDENIEIMKASGITLAKAVDKGFSSVLAEFMPISYARYEDTPGALAYRISQAPEETVMGSGLSFRASGGPVSSNFPYIVGEEGPELFVPNSSGLIMSNGRTRSMLGGGGEGGGDGGTVINIENITVNSDDLRDMADVVALFENIEQVSRQGVK